MKTKGLTLKEALDSNHLFRRPDGDYARSGFDSFNANEVTATDWELVPVSKNDIRTLEERIKKFETRLNELYELAKHVGYED